MESKTPDGVNGTDFLIIKFSKKSNGKAFLTDWKSTVDNLTIRYLKRVVVFTRAVDHLHVYTHLLDQSLQNLTKEKRFKLAKNWYDSFAALKDESAYIKFGFMSRDYHHEEDRLFVRSDMPSMTHCSLDGINDLIGTIRTVRANFYADETQAALAFMNAYKLLQDSLRAMVASRPQSPRNITKPPCGISICVGVFLLFLAIISDVGLLLPSKETRML